MNYDWLYYTIYTCGLGLCIILFAINYVARIQNPDIFIEENETWRKIEKVVGKKIAVFLIVPFTIIPMTMFLHVAIISPEHSILLGFFIGWIAMNAIVDVVSVSRMEPCKKCEFFPQKNQFMARCRECRNKQSGNWNVFLPLEYVIKKVKKQLSKKSNYVEAFLLSLPIILLLYIIVESKFFILPIIWLIVYVFYLSYDVLNAV